MDSDEYQAYLDGDEYEYHGGFYDVSPVDLEVPYDDYWYLVVDSNDRRIRVEITQVFDWPRPARGTSMRPRRLPAVAARSPWAWAWAVVGTGVS
jgi:hypothetical protein